MTTTTLPSGLVGEVRGLTGKDGRYLTNEQLVRDNEIEDYIFAHCWTSTVDPGPYDFTGVPDWGRVLVGDRYSLLIAVREATFPGKEYAMKLQCGRGGCKRRFEWEIDLSKLLAEKTKLLAPADRELFKAGNRFEDVIPFTKTPFVYQLQTGANAKRMQARILAKKTGPKKMQEKQNRLVDVIAGLVVEIGGVSHKGDAVFDFLEDLPLGSLDAMLPLMQSHDCGVETTIEVECTYCGGAMAIELPFDRAFFTPYTAAAKGRATASDETEGTATEEEKEAAQ